MLCRRRLVLALGHMCVVASAAAQGSSPVAGPAGLNTIGIPGTPAREAFIISPEGKPTKATLFPSLRLRSEVLGKTEKVEDFLSRHNLAADDKNRSMLRALNPSTDLTTGVIEAGSKIEVFSAFSQDTTQPVKLRYAFDSPNLTQYAFRSQAERARELSAAASVLPTMAFENSSLARVHVQATANLSFAAETLQAHSEKLSKLEFSVAQFQVEFASKQAADINAIAFSWGTPKIEQVLLASASARAAKDTAERLQSGLPALNMRTVEVNVYEGNSSKHVNPLQVYVIPSGVLNTPQLWTPQELQSFFSDFSFANDASPVSQAIPTNFDPRVCIGPKNAIKEMADLVARRELTKCRKPEITAANSRAVLTFRSPQDVANP